MVRIAGRGGRVRILGARKAATERKPDGPGNALAERRTEGARKAATERKPDGPGRALAERMTASLRRIVSSRVAASLVLGGLLTSGLVVGLAMQRGMGVEMKGVMRGSTPERLESASSVPSPEDPAIDAQTQGTARSAGWRYPIYTSLHEVKSCFGTRKLADDASARTHYGIDLTAMSGATIAAAAPGIVRVAGPGGGYGQHVRIDHGGGWMTLYGHMTRVVVRVGQCVEAGQALGIAGETGHVTGPHLHFELRSGGELKNPLAVLLAGAPDLRSSCSSRGSVLPDLAPLTEERLALGSTARTGCGTRLPLDAGSRLLDNAKPGPAGPRGWP